MKIKELFETPENLDDELVVIPNDIKKEYYDKMYNDYMNHGKKLGKYEGGLIKEIENSKGGSIVVISVSDKKVVYELRYLKDSILNNNTAIVQKIIRSRGDIPKISAHILFKYLLPKTGIVMSDTHQTKAGKNIWKRYLKIAEDKKLHIYIYHSKSFEIAKISTKDNNFETYFNAQYGDFNDDYQNRRFIISKKELS